MKKLIISISIIFSGFYATAQDGYDAVLQQIETNSATLAALRRQMEAQQLGNRTGIFLENPEVEFNYLWGNPALIGNRTDFSVRQSFDFPTAYAHRGRIADLQNANVELAYKAERLNVLLAAKRICIELIYHNALAKEHAVRLQNAVRIAEAYQAKLNAGETNVLENNKAQLNLATVRAEAARIETERVALLAELKTLNGGIDIEFPDNVYPVRILPANFENWYAETNNPILQYVSGQIEIERQQVRLNRALGLPRFSAGYMSERIVGEHFQGITAGVSIPLWENRNRVRQASVNLGERTLNVAVVHGIANARPLIESIQNGTQKIDFIEVMACSGGCIGGGGQPINFEVDAMELIQLRKNGLYQYDAGRELRLSCDNPQVKAIYSEFLGEPLGKKAKELLHIYNY